MLWFQSHLPHMSHKAHNNLSLLHQKTILAGNPNIPQPLQASISPASTPNIFLLLLLNNSLGYKEYKRYQMALQPSENKFLLGILYKLQPLQPKRTLQDKSDMKVTLGQHILLLYT